MKSRIILFIVSFTLLTSLNVFAQRGKHGAKTITAANTIVNEYTSLTADVSAGATTISVASSSLNANSRFPGALAAGDLIMIIQVQGATIATNSVGQIIEWGKVTNYNNCGLYELAQVLSVPNSTSISVECPLINSYSASGHTVVVRVPRYSSLTINSGGVLTGDTWDGTKGGILAVEVEGATIVNTGGSMDMSGKGFRGGVKLSDGDMGFGIGEYFSTDSLFGAEKGEGIAGYHVFYDMIGGRYCRGAAANGGGGGNAHNHGGGGGSNSGDTANWTGKGNPDISIPNYIQAWELEAAGFSTSTSPGGGRGGYSFSSQNKDALTIGPWTPDNQHLDWSGDYRRNWGGLGGRPLDYSAGRIFMGGGGGAGNANDGYASNGANGGGIILVQAYGSISGAGQIKSNGNTAANSTSGNGLTTTGADGAGGGGGGGAIILKAVGGVSGISATANGGNGGNQVISGTYSTPQAEGPGGGGGGGYIGITSGSITRTANGGNNGTTNASSLTEFPPNGATKGGAGKNTATVTTFWIVDMDDTICPGNSVTLTASLGGSPPTGTTLIWYDAIVGGNVLATGPSYTTPVLNTTTTYYVGSCYGTYHDSVTVYVNHTTANAGNDVSICNGATTVLNASGGVSYAWSPSYALSNTAISNPGATPAVTTTYIVTVTDNAGCTASDDVVVTVNGNINASAGNDATICPGSSTNLQATGGTTYSWSPTTGLSNTAIANPVASPASTTTYIVSVTNASGCTDADTVIVTVNSLPIVNAGADTTICTSGSAQLNASGGISYSWSPSAGLSASNISNPTASPSATTTYIVTATDANGCNATDDVKVTVSSNLVVSVNPSAPTTCSGGSVTLTATGGDSYTWSPSTGLSTTSGATVIATPAATTVYSVTATNAGGCSGSTTVTVTIGSNLVPTITPSSATVCSGSSVQLTASGGTTYDWSPSTGLSSTTGAIVTASPTVQTTYTVSVSDGGGCSGTASVTVDVGSGLSVSVSPSSPSICPGSSVLLTASGAINYSWSPSSGLSSTSGASVTANPTNTTTYSVTGTDASGCSGTANVIVTISNNLSATATSTNETCGQADGTATVTPSGSCTSGYTYQWNTVPVQTTPTAVQLSAGSYSVTVSCGGCSTAASVTVSGSSGPTVSVSSVNDAGCGLTNGGASISVTGGQSPYSYLWSNGQTGSSLVNVAAGNYSVTVQDASGCQAINNSVTIVNLPGPSITVSSIVNASCYLDNGSAYITVNGGTSPYFYSWSSIPVETSQNLLNVAAGTYTVTVTDGGGCTASGSVSITQTGGMQLAVSSTDENCGQMNGSVTVVATQGTGNYSYTWSTIPTQSTSSVTGLAAGTYYVTVTDGICNVIGNITVNAEPGPTAAFTPHPSILEVGGNVNFIDVSNGNVASWQWNFGDGSFSVLQSPEHEYSQIGTFVVTLTVIDADGCSDTYSDTIVVYDIFTLYIPNSFSPNDDGLNDYFSPKGLSVDPDDFEMMIFDRWGKLIFRTTTWNGTSAEGWNGTVNNEGDVENDIVMDVYVYRILCKDNIGQKHQYIGRVALLP